MRRWGTNVRPLECAVPKKSVFNAEDSQAKTTAKTFDHTYALPDSKVIKRRIDVLVKKVVTSPGENRRNRQINSSHPKCSVPHRWLGGAKGR